MPGPELCEGDVALWRVVALMARRLTGMLEADLQAQVGISVPDFDILMALEMASTGRRRIGDLGEMLAWEKSRTSHHVSRMEARGLLSRTTCDEDLRGTWVEITADGSERVARARPVHAAVVRQRLVDVLPDQDAQELARISLAVLMAAPHGACEAELAALHGHMNSHTLPSP